MSRCVWLYIVLRYWREIVTGWKQGWRRIKTYRVTLRVFVRETDDQPWRELDVDYLRSLVTKPTEAQAERAMEAARERGWLTDEGWVWEEAPDA